MEGGLGRAAGRMALRTWERLAHPFRRWAVLRRLNRRPSPGSVLVVCHGNICRSPYAAAVLQSRLVPLGVEVASAGFIQPGRPCPDAGVAVAAARGFDLSAHRSHLLATPEVHGAVLIMVRSTAPHWAIRELFGRRGDDVIVLGDLDPEPIEAREIRDPVEQPEEIFALSYSRIDRCIGEFVRVTTRRTEPVTRRDAREQTA